MSRATLSGVFASIMLLATVISYFNDMGREWMFFHGLVLGLWTSTWSRDAISNS